MENNNAIKLAELLKKQRNIFVISSVILLVINMLLAILLFAKDQKIILLPSLVSREYTLTKSSISNTYLEDIALDVAHLLLTVTPNTAHASYSKFLKNVYPSNYGDIRKTLTDMKNNLQKKNISSAFFVEEIASTKNSVKLSGQLTKIVSGTALEPQNK